MSVVNHSSPQPRADPSRRLSVRRGVRRRHAHPVVAVGAARLDRTARHAVVRLFLPRSRAGDAGRNDLVISPADGRISFAGFASPPPELGLGMAPLQRVSIFMSVFDCHVNRSPVGGRVERNSLSPRAVPQRRTRQGERGQRAQQHRHRRAGGQVRGRPDRGPDRPADRLLLHEGAHLSAGERIGLIRFGSRVDVYLPRPRKSSSASIRAPSREKR